MDKKGISNGPNGIIVAKNLFTPDSDITSLDPCQYSGPVLPKMQIMPKNRGQILGDLFFSSSVNCIQATS